MRWHFRLREIRTAESIRRTIADRVPDTMPIIYRLRSTALQGQMASSQLRRCRRAHRRLATARYDAAVRSVATVRRRHRTQGSGRPYLARCRGECTGAGQVARCRWSVAALPK